MKVKQFLTGLWFVLTVPWIIIFFWIGWTLTFLGYLQELRDRRNEARDQDKWATE